MRNFPYDDDADFFSEDGTKKNIESDTKLVNNCKLQSTLKTPKTNNIVDEHNNLDDFFGDNDDEDIFDAFLPEKQDDVIDIKTTNRDASSSKFDQEQRSKPLKFYKVSPYIIFKII